MKPLYKDMEQQWVRNLRSGSYPDFTRLYDLYADRLYGFAMKLTHSPSESKDIVQETFLRIWQDRKQLRTETSFQSYLFTISKNLIIDTFRKQINQVSFETYIHSEYYQNYSENSTENRIYYDEFIRKLEEAKQKLNDKQRLIFELHKEQGLEIAEIAERLSLSEKTVYNILSITLKILKSELQYPYLILFTFFYLPS